MSLLSTPIAQLPGLSAKRVEVLSKDAQIETYQDLLHFFPYKYVDRTRLYTIRELREDMPYVQLRGYLRDWKEVGMGRKKRLVGLFSDGTGMIELVWFRSTATIERMYTLGREYVILGKPQLFNGSYSIVHPEVEDPSRMEAQLGGLMPLYSSTERMRQAGITHRLMRQLLHRLLEDLYPALVDSLPLYLQERLSLMDYRSALVQMHFPDSTESLEAARRRLKFEELLFIQLRLQMLKYERKRVLRGLVITKVGEYVHRLYKEVLPFDLTGAQKRVIREIRSDMLSGKQMNRLVQGDVGSGKTLVALMAMLLVVDNGYQACLMAPTEILARQHHQGLQELLSPLGLEVELLIGSTTRKQRVGILERLSSGACRLIVGTHALLEEEVRFAQLGLAVIDEQHRFGVEQRSALWGKNPQIVPHILIMSATPIPRTLAMTLYGDLDVSVIDELPPGRKPVETMHCRYDQLPSVYNFIREQVSLGRQVYVVFPMIEEQGQEGIKTLEEGQARYQSIFPDYDIVLVHGKMKPRVKDAEMSRFAKGEAQILLATTVIEVGVNVPNASVMVIENANRFGLSQLHQLRGRVGRGAEQSYCLLLTDYALGEDAVRRMQIMVETSDGFEIAEEDMRLRGFGDMDGKRQSGESVSLRVANLAKDGAMVQYTRDLAAEILVQDPNLSLPVHALLLKHLQELYRLQEQWSLIS